MSHLGGTVLPKNAAVMVNEEKSKKINGLSWMNDEIPDSLLLGRSANNAECLSVGMADNGKASKILQKR